MSFFINFIWICLTSSHHYDAAFPSNLHGDGILFDPSVSIAALPSLYLGNDLFLARVFIWAMFSFEEGSQRLLAIIQMGESVIIKGVLHS